MKKMLLSVLAVVMIAGVVVAIVGWHKGWFGKKPEPVPVVTPPKEPVSKRKIEPPEDVVSTQGTARLDSIRKASNQDFSKAVTDWAKAPGVERKISWEAVRLGAKSSEDRQVRMRCCQLAQALAAGKPDGQPLPPAADEKAVEPLLACLGSGDAGLALAAVGALGTINVHNPVYKVEQKALPEVKKLLAGDDPAGAASALSAVAFFAETSMIPDVLTAWEKHGKSPGFAEKARDHLKILLELQLRENLKKEHADWSKEQCLAEAKPKAQELAGQFGADLAKWKAWWAGLQAPAKAN
jgi:hypothetical protein